MQTTPYLLTLYGGAENEHHQSRQLHRESDIGAVDSAIRWLRLQNRVRGITAPPWHTWTVARMVKGELPRRVATGDASSTLDMYSHLAPSTVE